MRRPETGFGWASRRPSSIARSRPDEVLHYAKQQIAKLQEAQRQFDSPEENAGNLTACWDENPKLRAAARKRAGRRLSRRSIAARWRRHASG